VLTTRKLKGYIVDVIILFLKITFLRRLESFKDFYHTFYMKQLMRKDHIAWNVECAKDAGVHVGENCRFLGNITYSTEPYLIEIGDNTIISGCVDFITHDGAVLLFNDGENDIFGHFGKIKIGSNCFIGFKSMFLPDVQIGDNCIVAAGSVIMNSFPDNSIIMGNPAKLVSHVDIFRKIKMSSKNTIRSKEYPFPKEEEMPKDQKKQMVIKHFENLPIRKPRSKKNR